MLRRAAPPTVSPPPTDAARGLARDPARAAARVLAVGGHVLESVGRLRVESRNLDREARLRRRGARLQRVCDELCRVHGFEARVEGTLPRGPVVLVANHLSYIDAPLLGALTACTAIAKGEVRGWPLVGAGTDALGVLFVRRGDPFSGARALRAGLRALAAGVSVLGFPEGTTSDGSDVLPFRRGMFGLARLAGVPIVPIALQYLDRELCWVGDTWFLPHYLRTAMRPRSSALVRVGAPIGCDEERRPEALAERARDAIRSLLLRSRA